MSGGVPIDALKEDQRRAAWEAVRNMFAAEVAAREAAAFQRGAEAMREKAAAACQREAADEWPIDQCNAYGAAVATACAAAIRALPVPEDAALRAMAEEAPDA